METGVGDRLARGAASAVFQASDGKITAEKWQKAFEGWSLDEFMKGGSGVKKSENKERTRV